jgi:hypothetical protein
MPKSKSLNEIPCPTCGSHDLDDLLRPYCSVVCRALGCFGLGWKTNPYRIVVGSHPHLVVQAGPSFDLRELVLKGARERALATERKRRQRAGGSLPDVTPNKQSNASISRSFSIPRVENRQEEESHGNCP